MTQIFTLFKYENMNKQILLILLSLITIHLKAQQPNTAPTINVMPGLVFPKPVERLPDKINSVYDELCQVISPDGKILYFARRGDPQNIGDQKWEDIYYSILDSTGEWGTPVNMGTPLNNEWANAICSISPDGNTMLLLTNIISEMSLGNTGTGAHISRRAGSSWTPPQKLNIKNDYSIDRHVTYSLSNNGKVLLMTLERTDGEGATDIYVCFLQGNGDWSEPLNLGPVINTEKKDFAAFLAADGVTLYFSSEGHPGYGDADVFISKRLDSTWTKWSKPYNLGPTVNNEKLNGYFTIAASGQYAYFVSRTEEKKRDIFRIELPKQLKPEPVVLISGKVYNAKTKQPIAANINYEDLLTHQSAGIASSNEGTGDYKIVLPYGKHYGYNASAFGYIAISENFDLTTVDKKYKEVTRDLYLVPIEAGQSLVLNNMFFIQGKSTLIPTSYPELNRLVDILTTNPGVSIELSGHTDNQGDAQADLLLSEDRVKTVKNYLVSKGINEKRITGKGYGRTKPIVSNDTPENRQRNRRVEVTITAVDQSLQPKKVTSIAVDQSLQPKKIDIQVSPNNPNSVSNSSGLDEILSNPDISGLYSGDITSLNSITNVNIIYNASNFAINMEKMESDKYCKDIDMRNRGNCEKFKTSWDSEKTFMMEAFETSFNKHAVDIKMKGMNNSTQSSSTLVVRNLAVYISNDYVGFDMACVFKDQSGNELCTFYLKNMMQYPTTVHYTDCSFVKNCYTAAAKELVSLIKKERKKAGIKE
jgi:outer membrane protein OmpA-like peptidoglycan-associated protein